MKSSIVLSIVFLFFSLSNCLKAKRSPFDISKPSPGLMGIIASILNSRSTSSPSSTLPTVVSTSPADASTGITANIPVSITFNFPMDKSTITTNSDDTTCSGSVQISFDNFATCVKMRSSISTTDNKTFTLTSNPTMGTFATHKIKVTTTATSDAKVKLEKDFSHATGFTTSTPCTVYDAVTCPIPFSTAVTLNNALSNGAQIIPIESGPAKGKILIVMGANAPTSTNIFNPDTGIITSGPTLTGSVNITESSAYFFINSGIHNGKVLIIHEMGLQLLFMIRLQIQ